MQNDTSTQDSMSFYRRFKRINNGEPGNAAASRNDQILGGQYYSKPAEHADKMEFTQPRATGYGVNDSTET